MLGPPTQFWGKLQRSDHAGPVLAWHPLIDHCADVAAVTEALLLQPTWRQRLSRLAGRTLEDGMLARLSVLAALHDLGKFNLGFQAKGRPELGPTAGHVTEALAALFKSDLFRDVHTLGVWGDGVTSLLVAAICHHGRPYKASATAGSWQATWWAPRAGLDPRLGAAELFRSCQQWFPRAFEAAAAPLPEVPELGHAFAGVVMLADWIGSDTRFFPFAEAADGDRMHANRPRAQRALAELGIDLPLDGRADLRGRRAFARIADSEYTPRPAQEVVASLPCNVGGSITILEAETGSGKTEAALARFVSLFEAGRVDGLYFALPTRSAAMQIHRRVVDAVRRAFVSPPAVVLAVPGYLRVDDAEGQRLPAFEVLWPDRDRFRYRGWAAENTKRYLAGPIVVGTVDQVLLSSLMVGHAHLRASALLRHLLVVDEVHASDAYMTRILQTVLGRQLAAGGHALLLSATLGAEARARLLRPGESGQTPSLDEAVLAPYPLVTHRAACVEPHPVAIDAVERVVWVASQPWLESHEALAEAALAAAEQGAKVLVVKNTVADCLATQTALERLARHRGALALLFGCQGTLAPHHSRFARADRQALDAALEAQFGKAREPGGCVVVATQTVQQSLDLDADVLFSDLCPADVLLQRMGRLHRHARPRPTGFDAARATVVVPQARDLGVLIGEAGHARHHHGLGSVYGDLRILEATWRLVETHPAWRVPTMSRLLVERSLHSSVLADIVEQGGPRWRGHAAQMLGLERGHTRLAELNIVDWSAPYGDSSFPDAVDQRIATRLGEGDRRVRFAPRVMGPFGLPVDELVLRAWWAAQVPADAEYGEQVTTTAGATRFAFGLKPFIYDRFGVRPETSAPAEDSVDDGP